MLEEDRAIDRHQFIELHPHPVSGQLPASRPPAQASDHQASRRRPLAQATRRGWPYSRRHVRATCGWIVYSRATPCGWPGAAWLAWGGMAGLGRHGWPGAAWAGLGRHGLAGLMVAGLGQLAWGMRVACCRWPAPAGLGRVACGVWRGWACGVWRDGYCSIYYHA